MRAKLLETTFERKYAIPFGTLSIVFLALATAVMARVSWPYIWILAELGLFMLRFRLIDACEAARDEGRQGPVAALMATAGLWAVLFGLGCFGSMATGHPAVSVLAALNVAGVAGVASSRNAATPRFALFVMIAVILPSMVGTLLGYPPGLFLVGLQMPFYAAGITALLMQNHHLNVRMIRAELDNRDLATKDPLTDLANRIALQERLRRMCDSLSRQGSDKQPFAVFSMDLDGFKQVNDSYGHGTGDLLLQQVAERLTRALRSGDAIYRVGGDEFVALLPATSEIEAAYLARRILEKITAPFDVGVGSPVFIGISIGSALAPAGGERPETLLAASDIALYQAKRSGKGRHTTHVQNAG